MNTILNNTPKVEREEVDRRGGEDERRVRKCGRGVSNDTSLEKLVKRGEGKHLQVETNEPKN